MYNSEMKNSKSGNILLNILKRNIDSEVETAECWEPPNILNTKYSTEQYFLKWNIDLKVETAGAKFWTPPNVFTKYIRTCYQIL